MTAQGVTGSLSHKMNSHLIGFEIMFPYERRQRRYVQDEGTYQTTLCHNSYHNQQYFDIFDSPGCYAASLGSLLVP
jgi:hypothetical protein